MDELSYYIILLFIYLWDILVSILIIFENLVDDVEA